MDWNRGEGNCKQFKGNIKEKWGKLTDNDLNASNGRRDRASFSNVRVTAKAKRGKTSTSG